MGARQRLNNKSRIVTNWHEVSDLVIYITVFITPMFIYSATFFEIRLAYFLGYYVTHSHAHLPACRLSLYLRIEMFVFRGCFINTPPDRMR